MVDKKDFDLIIGGVKQKMIFVETPKERLQDTDFYWVDIGTGFPDGFWVAETLVTQEFWAAVTGTNWIRSRSQRDKEPVDNVSWEEIAGRPEFDGKVEKDPASFVFQLNHHADAKNYLLENMSFQLPTEAQWEFTARGGLLGLDNKHKYAGSNQLKHVGWFEENSKAEPHPVKKKLPNELGVFDMSGNLWECCADFYREDLNNLEKNGLANETPDDPIDLSRHVVRGGCYGNPETHCRVSNRSEFLRYGYGGSIGFRVFLY